MSRFRPNARDNGWIWWLPWLLPYLFFSVAVDGLHNHAVLPAGVPASSVPDSGSRRSSSPATVPTHTVPTGIDGDDAGCLACQWNSMTSAVAAFPPVLRTPVNADVEVTANGVAPAIAIFRRGVSRGPPAI